MCGIAGIYHLDLNPVDTGVFRRMTGIIRHRGPDDEGFWLVNTQTGMSGAFSGEDSTPEIKSEFPPLQNALGANLALGFRRLSIIDLSRLGHQPMCDYTGSVWIIFNGEIYNYLEIRNELESAGYNFISRSDTEVILNAYLHWGVECLNRFNGMWAFALYDTRKRQLICARDRFGVKPFFYSWDGKSLFFASEIKQILECGIDREINEDVIRKSFAIGSFLINSDSSYFNRVKILPHGHYFLLGPDGNLNIKRYYDLSPLEFESSQLSFGEACTQYRTLFTDAVKLRMRSDVEVGSTLSGGLDSSAIVSIAAGHTGRQFKTFSAWFNEEPGLDERKWIKLVTDKVQADAHYVSPEAVDVSRDFRQITWHHDYPVLSSSPVAQYYVMKLAHENKAIVLLDGQGSDEIIGGYHHAFYRHYADLLRSLRFAALGRELPVFLKGTAKGSPLSNLFKILLPVFFSEHTLYQTEAKRAFSPFLPSTAPVLDARDIRSFTTTSRLSQFLYNQLMSVSVQTLLHYEDRNSMAHSIESRVPFLDYRLVELAFSLPSGYKMKGYQGKYIHRQALRELVPQPILERKDKVGFLAPGEHFWLRGGMREMVSDLFCSRHFLERGIYDHRKIRKAWELYLGGDTRKGSIIWKVMALETWFRVFVDENGLKGI
ncbi:MAG: asparagine synthase (glutamine-hydrolyzing) [Bacteroidales bacterium]